MSADRKSDTNVETLSNSSAPTGEPPKFAPMSRTPVEEWYRTLKRPMMRSPRERLLELVEEYERVIGFYNLATSIEDATYNKNCPQAQEADVAAQNAARILRELEFLIEGIPATSVFELGLKARVISWSSADLWDDRSCEENSCRNLVDNVLSLAGMDRLRRGDSEFSELLGAYKGPKRFADVPMGDPGQPAPASDYSADELDRLADQYSAAIERFSILDKARGGSGPWLKEAEEDFSAKIQAIEGYASHVQASTAKGALLQTILTFFEVENLSAWVDCVPGSEPKLERFSHEAVHRNINRMLYSIRGYLEKQAGITVYDLIKNYGMPAAGNPFDVEARRAILDQAQALADDKARRAA